MQLVVTLITSDQLSESESKPRGALAPCVEQRMRDRPEYWLLALRIKGLSVNRLQKPRLVSSNQTSSTLSSALSSNGFV